MLPLTKNYFLVFIILLLTALIEAGTVRIMTYNLLHFEDENDRENDFRSIISLIEPIRAAQTQESLD